MPQNTNVKKGFKLKKKTLTTDVWSELDGRKLHPPFSSDEPPLSFGQGWVNIFFWAVSRYFGLGQYFFGLAQETFLACSIFFLALLKRYFVAGSIFYFVWAASRYRVFFFTGAP